MNMHITLYSRKGDYVMKLYYLEMFFQNKKNYLWSPDYCWSLTLIYELYTGWIFITQVSSPYSTPRKMIFLN